MKQFLKSRFPAAVIAAGKIKAELLTVASFVGDTLKPQTMAQVYRVKKDARARAKSRRKRIEEFRPTQFEKVMLLKLQSYNIGFFGCVLFALNQLSYCERRNYFPVVYFGKKSGPGRNDFYDPRFGRNMWDYYFEPVAGLTYDDVDAMLKDPNSAVKRDMLFELSPEELRHLHFDDPESVFPYPYGYYFDKTEYDPAWYRTQRAKANQLVTKYIKLKKHLRDEIEIFHDRHMKGAYVVGVHLRGTDKLTNVANPKAMKIIGPEDYFKRLDPMLKSHSGAKVFVATDQEQFLDEFKMRYGAKVVHCNSVRSKTNRNVFQKGSLNGYRLGKDVLLEAQLLSRCQYFMKCTSTVGEAVLWFNPNLEHIDLNYAS